MNLRYEIRRIDKANKSNPYRAETLLMVCINHIPEERKNALSYLEEIRQIESVWREYASENGLDESLFRCWVAQNLEIASVLGW